MSDPLSNIPLQTPTATTKNAAALQTTLNGNPYVVEYVLPGHPIPLQTEWVITTLQTNFILIPAPGLGVRTAITKLDVLLSPDASVNVAVRIGFATTTLPVETTSGSNAVPLNHGLTPGGGIVLGNGSAVICQGPANLPLRITNTVPTGGKLVILATYFQPALA